MSQHYPQHIGIIPDGNRTRAKEQGMTSLQGHLKGKENSSQLAKYIFEQTPIKVFTIRGLSAENLYQRPHDELDWLFDLFRTVTDDLKELMVKEQINLKRIGSPTGLPTDLVDYFHEQEKIYSFPTDRYLCLCINYGGRDEIIRAIQKWKKADGDETTLSESVLEKYLDFGGMPPLDLVIRTKGDKASRISGFMLRWIGYAELFFSPHKFPAFDTTKLQQALQRFHDTVDYRNFGK